MPDQPGQLLNWLPDFLRSCLTRFQLLGYLIGSFSNITFSPPTAIFKISSNLLCFSLFFHSIDLVDPQDARWSHPTAAVKASERVPKKKNTAVSHGCNRAQLSCPVSSLPIIVDELVRLKLCSYVGSKGKGYGVYGFDSLTKCIHTFRPKARTEKNACECLQALKVRSTLTVRRSQQKELVD